MEKSEKQKHFVLVHGACHGAWCWYKVVTLLRSKGHRVTALDMAGAGVHPKRLEELASFSDYSNPLLEFLAALTSEERFPQKIEVAVFVSSFMPGPDTDNLAIRGEFYRQMDHMDCKLTFDNGDDKHPTSILFGPSFYLISYISCPLPRLEYQHLLNYGDLALATLLMRPIISAEFEEEITLSKENYGSVPRVYLICENDIVINQRFQNWAIEINPCDEVKMISGADHMAMFSKPQELCSFLQEIAEKY
ncbi:salicylic acid-binding 2-like [Olea europaea subsp. europaea]|uniref:Salicylic acid-binding 2-like n=1 Tax=Olea europaea subsp. europaea TaxID=158383 RepID=A0A8S0R663_OLEEU|nr:salicylic acid-binding 2-like [Olea europaea subsp. europaea]